MAASLTPIVRWQILVDGEPVSGAKLYTYASGTSTPLSVYSNADLNPIHAHTNPVVADSDGVFPVIYLSAASYRFLVTDSVGATIYPAQDDVYDQWQLFTATTQTANTVYAGPTTGSAAAPTFRALVMADLPTSGSSALFDNGLTDFRLTPSTGTPVTTADVTAATTLYAAPYCGNRIVLFDAAGLPIYCTSSEFSIAVPATTSTMYDVFCYASGTTPTLELLAWSSDTARATALVSNVATGVYTKSGDATRRYLGSFRTTGSSGQTESSFAKRYIWNYYNRVMLIGRVTEGTNSWTDTNTTPHQANGSAANQLDFVIGVAEVAVTIDVYGAGANATAAAGALRVGIGEDATNAYAAGSVFLPANFNSQSTVTICPFGAHLQKYPAVGRHYYAWLEQSGANGTTTWYGDGGGTDLNQGIVGWTMG